MQHVRSDDGCVFSTWPPNNTIKICLTSWLHRFQFGLYTTTFFSRLLLSHFSAATCVSVYLRCIFIGLFLKHFTWVHKKKCDLSIANCIDRIGNPTHRNHRTKLFTHALHASTRQNGIWLRIELGMNPIWIHISPAWMAGSHQSIQPTNQPTDHWIIPSNNQINAIFFESFDWLFKPQIVLSYFSCGRKLLLLVFCLHLLLFLLNRQNNIWLFTAVITNDFGHFSIKG